MPVDRTMILSAMCVFAVGCTHTSDIESIAYTTYAKTQHAEIIDLVGASNISVRFASEIDTSDRWFAFKISRENFVSLVGSVAKNNEGPTEIEWSENPAIPNNWHPRHSPPSWWKISPTKDFKAISWCHAAKSSNYNGWYLYHDADTDNAVCWHWRYQHAGEMCEK